MSPPFEKEIADYEAKADEFGFAAGREQSRAERSRLSDLYQTYRLMADNLRDLFGGPKVETPKTGLNLSPQTHNNASKREAYRICVGSESSPLMVIQPDGAAVLRFIDDLDDAQRATLSITTLSGRAVMIGELRRGLDWHGETDTTNAAS